MSRTFRKPDTRENVLVNEGMSLLISLKDQPLRAEISHAVDLANRIRYQAHRFSQYCCPDHGLRRCPECGYQRSEALQLHEDCLP